MNQGSTIMAKKENNVINSNAEKMQVCQEELKIKKRRIPVKKLSIRKRTKYTDFKSEIPLVSEQLSYTEVPFNTEVEQIPEVRQEGDTTIIPVIKEIPIISKKIVLIKEIHITRSQSLGTETIEAKLRSEEVEITGV